MSVEYTPPTRPAFYQCVPRRQIKVQARICPICHSPYMLTASSTLIPSEANYGIRCFIDAVARTKQAGHKYSTDCVCSVRCLQKTIIHQQLYVYNQYLPRCARSYEKTKPLIVYMSVQTVFLLCHARILEQPD